MIRLVVVGALTLWALAGILPDFSVPWRPYSELGFYFNGDYTITDVKPNSPASLAGIVPGDRLNLTHTRLEFKRYIPPPLSLGKKVTIAIDHDGKVRYLTLVAQRRERSAAENVSLILRLVSALLFVGIGTVIVLLRPTPMTWALYLFSVGTTPTWVVIPTFLPLALLFINDFFTTIALPIGWGGFFIFALRFPADEVRGTRRTLEGLTIYVTAALVLLQLYNNFGYLFDLGVDVSQRLSVAFFGILYAAGLLAFVQTYLHSVGPVRRRVEWIMVGFAFGLATTLLSMMLDVLARDDTTVWITNSLAAVNILVPLTLGYAVIKHRVIDVRFVVNRALVYGAMTSLLVAVFGLIDWFFSKELVNGKLGTLAEVVTAVALGFWLNSMHRNVDYFIDSVFFRERHRVERHLTRVTAALSVASSRKAVAESLVDEPVGALGLTSAALLIRSDKDIFTLQRSIGWDDCSLKELPADDLLLMQLCIEQAPLSLHDVRWRISGLPPGNAQPTMAVPIMVRFQLWGVVFYGSHTHGEEMDPDEVAILRNLALAAAAAFDHIQAEELRVQIDVLTREVGSLRATATAPA